MSREISHESISKARAKKIKGRYHKNWYMQEIPKKLRPKQEPDICQECRSPKIPTLNGNTKKMFLKCLCN